MAKTPDKTRASRVAELLRRIDRGDDIRRLVREADRIAKNIGPVELTAAGESLLEEGYAPTIVTHLSAVFLLMQRYGHQLSGPKDHSQEGHILQRVTAEHAVFRCLAAELREVATDLGATEHVSDTTTEYRRLIHAVGHLHAIKEHFEREDDVILPYLRKLGWASLCVLAGKDHAQLRVQIDCLTSLITETQTLSPDDFLLALMECIDKFCSGLSEHLSFEDGLLWPIALVVIDDPAIWRTMKTFCEEIGYCGIHAA